MDRAAEAERMLDRALELPADERAAFLDAVCAGDPDLRREVGALLPYAEGDPHFLESPILRPSIPDVAHLLSDSADPHGGSAAPALPEEIGGYRIVRLLGAGGMGLVYEARQPETDRPVALKLLYPGPLNPALLRRFAAEARLLGRLQHPGIPQIFEMGLQEETRADGRVERLPFLVMELVEGERLDRWAGRSDRPLASRLGLFTRICAAVAHAHRRGIIHRDLKPANILVDAVGRPKILDFGIARLVSGDSDPGGRLTTAGQLLGSLAYMSPEQLSGNPERVDERSDIYALGVILLEMVAGPLPEGAEPPTGTEGSLPTGLAPRRPLRGDLSRIVAKATDKDRERRYRTATELALDVRRLLGRRPLLARLASFWHDWKRSARRHPVVGASLVATLLVLLVVGLATRLALDRAERRDHLQLLAYRSAVEAAVAALDNDDEPFAREALLSTPAALRGWEWRYLWSRSQPAGISVEARHGLAASPPTLVLDGTDLLSLGSARGYRFSASTGELVASWRLADERMRQVGAPAATRVVHSDDGRYFAVGTADGQVRLYPAGGPACATTRGEEVLYGPPGSAVAAVLAAAETTLEVWSLAPCAERFELALRADELSPRRLRFDAGGTWLVSDGDLPGGGGEVRIRDADGGRLLRQVAHSATASAPPAVAPDRDAVAVATTDGRLRLLDLATGRTVLELPNRQGPLTRLRLDPTGRLLAAADDDRLVRVWALDGGVQRARFRTAGSVTALRFSADGSKLYIASRLPSAEVEKAAAEDRRQDQRITLLDLDYPFEAWVLRGRGEPVQALAFSPDGETLAAAGASGEIILWDPLSFRRIARLAGPTRDLRWLAFSGDGSRLISASSREVAAWDLATGGLVARLRRPTGQAPPCAPDLHGRRVLLGWDAAARRASVWSLEGRGVEITGLGVFTGVRGAWRSPDGRYACQPQPAEGATVVLDLRRGGLHRLPSSSPRPVFAWSHGVGGAVLLAGPLAREPSPAAESGSTLGIWEAASGTFLGTLPGHGRRVLAVAFSPDDRRLATGDRDGAVRLWDPLRREEMARLSGHQREIEALAFSPDGRTLASASRDGTVRIWDTLPSAEHRTAWEGQRRLQERARALVTSLWTPAADPGALAARLRRDPHLEEALRREALRELLRRSAGTPSARRGAPSEAPPADRRRFVDQR